MELPWISPKYYAGYLRSLQQRYNDELMAKPRFYLTKIIPNSHGKAFRVLKPVGKDLGAYRYDYVFDQGWNIKVPKGEEINLHFYSELPIDQFKLKVPVDSLSSYEVVEVNSVEQKRGRGYDYIIQYKAEYDGILALYPGEEEMVRYKLTIEEKVKKK